MNYFAFQPQFHDLIRQRVKLSTIRGKAKVKVGERFALRMWTGAAYRSKMGMLGTAVCVEVSPIVVHVGKAAPYVVDGLPLDSEQIKALAVQEGFPNKFEMLDWFQYTHEMPFHGILTRWDPATFEAAA